MEHNLKRKQNKLVPQIMLWIIFAFIVIVVVVSVSVREDDNSAIQQVEQTDYVHDVCPPFHLLDENGDIIDPVKGINSGKPYSPKQTCGKCHDYEKITEGFHFTQGKGESPTPDQAKRCLWVTTPGNYGGTWCSPAPLYRYLSPKHNDDPKLMDMTSFSFITAGCGVCHPGGGSVEYDREGKRYDRWMSDSASGFTPRGVNNYDGDYYQARWSETGVLEADCLLCHMPEYSFTNRKRQIDALNFRWAPVAGADFAAVNGSIAGDSPVTVHYNTTLFNPDGTISPHIVREPRNEACLECHAKPGWKKRGANFRPRTDVHLRAGLKCVDCHPAGSAAEDSRINEREMHQFAKGDDPGGQVRNDLDNTCLDCVSCHTSGKLGAPVAKHQWLPPLHLEEIACQTCHIPERAVKAALVQAGDVFNPGAKIPTKGKHLWTFYAPDMTYWNHYGDLDMMGYDDKPTDIYKPVLARYKGKIFPVNRVHSAWPAIEIDGEQGMMQPKMGDIYAMWTDHQKDQSKYPELARIIDDNEDNIPEINTSEEIDALINSVTNMLNNTGYPMDGKRVVWVMNDRVYSSGAEYRLIDKHEWEASPYGNVHKYNHDVYPARAALGINGCTDCHNTSSDFFFASIVKYPFGENARPITEPQYTTLGLKKIWIQIGAVREEMLKPLLYALLIALICIITVFIGELLLPYVIERNQLGLFPKLMPWVAGVVCGIFIFFITTDVKLSEYMLPSRFWLDSRHFFVAVFIFIMTAVILFINLERTKKLYRIDIITSVTGMILGGVSGTFMLFKIPFFETITRMSYTVFDISLVLMVITSLIFVLQESISHTMGLSPKG
ncbi:MAG: hypothetical protein JXB48_19090 [Candidatus Latescibacteria bacterium]|nr:hypothetical protein [Candidatus Latescibacterota bacterium]